ncbi:nickel transporter permease [Natrarchaeobius chitinivorans]|uniref:ABC transporter permease n=1 Tax=Natrarchaeobius chitinivorans TaxID=1679083 RepID=A0A3N6LYA4_NATCH|nr:nickel transporter permease [Natrarchaeobius chitinivorans]RQG95788.1 ABC transporter permease [Natrarchaeobius chitinivorans]
MSAIDDPGRVEPVARASVRRALRRNPASLAGGIVVAVVAIVAVVGPALVGDPNAGALSNRLQPPSAAHPFGTDPLGRDVLTRLVHGARITLAVAVAITLVRLVIGFVVGLVAGLFGGLVDEALMRVVDFLLAFPGIVLALVIAGVLGPSLRNVLLALAVVGWGSYARVVRSSVLSVREEPFVDAAKLAGISRVRLVWTHFVPNVAGPVVVLATLDLGGVVLAAAGLSFLGLGAQPPTPEWGAMVADGADYLRSAPWLVNVPGIAIAALVVGFNLLGDGLRDALDTDPTEVNR